MTRCLVASLLAISIAPVLAVDIPAMADYPNHLARMHLIVSAGTADANPFYELHWWPLTNRAMDLIVPMIAPAVGVELGSRLFLLAAQLLIVTGAVALEIAVKGRHQYSGIAALLAIYSTPFAWGFLNFEFGLGLALWGVAAWLVIKRRTMRFLAQAAFLASITISHSFAAAIYGLTLAVIELAGPLGMKAKIRNLTELIFSALLIVPALTAGGITAGSENIWSLSWKANSILWSMSGYSTILSTVIVTGALMFAFILWRRGALSISRPGGWLLLAFTLAFVVTPFQLYGVAFVDVRIVVAAWLILPAFVTISWPSRRWAVVSAATASAVIVAHGALVLAVWITIGADYRAVKASFSLLPQGSKVLVAQTGGKDPPDNLFEYPMHHAPTLAAHYAKALVPSLFSVEGAQPIVLRNEYKRFATITGPIPINVLVAIMDGRIRPDDVPLFARDWARVYSYLYLLGRPHNNPMPSRLSSVEEQPAFTLYKIMSTGDE